MKIFYKILIALLLLAQMPFSPMPQTAHAAILSRPPNNLGLVGYWAMNEGAGVKAGDASGRGNTGTLSGTTIPTWADGKHGKALSFGGDDYVEVADNSSLNPGSSSFTVSVWFKMNTVGNRDGSILYNKENLFEASAGGGYFTYAWQPHWAWDGGTSFPVNVGEWYHAVVVYDKAKQYVYKNGNEVYSRDQTGDISTNTNTLRIGARGSPGAASAFFNGLIDDVRIYNRALSPTEITNLYQSGSAKIKSASNTGLVGYWPMNEGDGVQAGDFSGNGNTGTITGATWADGKLGKALSFNGSTDEIIAGNGNSLQLTSGTVSAWIKTSNAGSSYRGIIAKQLAYGMFLQGNEFGMYDWGASLWRGSGYSPNNGNWHFLLCTFQSGVDNGTLCYADNVLKLTTKITVSAQTITLQIGEANAGQNFGGIIDDVRIYNRALSLAEITALYQSGSVKIKSASNTGLVGYWPMNEGDGVQAGDFSGNGNTGTITGATWTNGKLGKALSFDGSDYVDGGTSTTLNGGDNFTAVAWFKVANQNFTDRTISSKRGTGISGATGWEIKIASATTIYGYSSCNTTPIEITATVTNLGSSWHQIVFSIDNKTGQLYLDGVAVGSPQTGVGAHNVTGYIMAVGSKKGTVNFFDGLIDEVRIYNRALSPTEVLQLYNSK